MCRNSPDPYLAKAVYYIEQKLRANVTTVSCAAQAIAGGKSRFHERLITKKVDGIILALQFCTR